MESAVNEAASGFAEKEHTISSSPVTGTGRRRRSHAMISSIDVLLFVEIPRCLLLPISQVGQ
jgi:hypothetical protein